MNSAVEQQLAEPRLLVAWDTTTNSQRWRVAGAVSVAVHVVLFLAVLLLGGLPQPPPVSDEARAKNTRVTPLVAPLRDLTQREPNRAALSKEFNLESIPSRPSPSSEASPGAADRPQQKAQRRFSPPAAPKAPVPSPVLEQAPAIETAQLRAPQAPPQGFGNAQQVAPPQIRAEEKPKLAFENPGSPSGVSAGQAIGRVPAPKASVDEAIRGAARAGRGGIVLGDTEDAVSGIGPSPRSSPMPGKLGSSLELVSDPQGADFRPYLARVLAAVRRNWYSVIPESARLGRTGRVVIQFAINRDGSVPKLVIANPSGADALDRAGVAGISASNPFPPLPEEFTGAQIRLQLAFSYNMTGR